MSLPEFPRLVRLLLALTLAGLTAGCFQPLYGDPSGTMGGAGVRDKMSAVSVEPVVTSGGGGRLPRVGGEVRNELIYQLTGGGEANTTSYRLFINMGASNYQLIVDPGTNRSDVQNYGIDASYRLVEVGTGRQVASGSTFSRVSFDTPGQEQRFAGLRGLRDAENRAAKVIAENIKSRLASYFTAGT